MKVYFKSDYYLNSLHNAYVVGFVVGVTDFIGTEHCMQFAFWVLCAIANMNILEQAASEYTHSEIKARD